MFKKQKSIDDISVKELEHILRLKRRQERQERFLRLSNEGHPRNHALLTESSVQPIAAVDAADTSDAAPGAKSTNPLASATITSPRKNKKRETLLLTLEIGALVGLVAVLIFSYLNLRTLNDEVVVAQSSRLNQVISERLFNEQVTSDVAEGTNDFRLDRLPGGHSSPTAPGGAVPDIPPHLQNWVQPAPAVPIESQSYEIATRIVIPKINVDAPIVQGVTWEDLKKGVGQLPGSAGPGERGNMYLAAHNDIYGEIFRYLEKLEEGDEYHVYAGDAKYTYIVREKRIIEPTEVDVMLPTTEPVATLQTCYPYLINTHRLVIISDLVS